MRGCSVPFWILIGIGVYLWLFPGPDPYEGQVVATCGTVVQIGAAHRPGLVIYEFFRDGRTQRDTDFATWPNPTASDLLIRDSVLVLYPLLDSTVSSLGYNPLADERRPVDHQYELRPPGHPGRLGSGGKG
jgi:hypothetical protein